MSDRELIEAPVGFLTALQQLINDAVLPMTHAQHVRLHEGFKLCRVVTEKQKEKTDE